MLISILTLLLSGQSVAAPEPLKPSAKWVVDYAEDMCTLGREFGPDKITFGLRPSQIGGAGALGIVMMPGAHQSRHYEFQGKLKFADGDEAEVRTNAYWLQSQKTRVVTVNFSAESIAKLKAGEPFGFPVGRNQHVWFRPDGIQNAMVALEDCNRDLMISIGVPPDELAAVSAGPKGDVAKMFGHAAYPSGAVLDGKSGSTFALLAISAEGVPTDCRIISNHGHEAFKQRTCDAAMRARFEPGRNAAGEAVRSWYPLRVTWRLD